MPKCVLAFSGGLDTLVAISWLRERRNFDVVALAVNVGQGEDLEELGELALRAGAVAARIEDLRESFYSDFIAPSLRALAHYEKDYLLAAALSRPLIARELVRVAQDEGASYVAHGCSSKGNDQVRFEAAIGALAPNLKIVAPLREWEYHDRQQRIDYARAKNLPMPPLKPAGLALGYDRNLWGQSIELGAQQDPAKAPPEEAFTLTVNPIYAPNQPEQAELEFRDGLPVALNGRRMKPVELIERLNEMAGAHGVGRTDIIEDRLMGFKSREVYEAPAAHTLYTAKRALEQLTLSRETLRVRDGLAVAYGQCIYNGQWFSELREALDAFYERLGRTVTGKVAFYLYKGTATVVARSSEYSLYAAGAASSEHLTSTAAEGFIKVWSSPMAAEAKRKKKKK
jgi:argininosuccinate synthase